MYDLGIIGGGPAGYTAAEHAAKLGMKVILFEKNELGGVCLNEGCIPTKTLLYSTKLLENIRSASKYGILTETPGFDYSKIVARKNKVVRKLNAGIRAKLNHPDILVVTGEACISGRDEKGFALSSDGEEYVCRNVLVCSGSQNIMPPIIGLLPDEVWTNREALLSKELPSRIAVIGGGVIGVEFAGLYNSLGVEVTVFEMQNEILFNTADAEVAKALREELTKKGVTFCLSAVVTEVKDKKLYFEQEGTVHEFPVERIFVSVGRRPNVSGIGLENFSLEYTPNKGIVVDEHMQSACPGIFAAGDVTGHSMLAHTAVREAEVAVNYMFGEYDMMSYKAIPSVIYTNPEAAGVGETEETLLQKNIPYEVLKLPMTYSGRFVAENEGGNGLCKILVGTNDQILGVHLLGNSSSEIISSAVLAIEQNLTVEQWQKQVFPHPSVSEIMKETLNTFDLDKIV